MLRRILRNEIPFELKIVRRRIQNRRYHPRQCWQRQEIDPVRSERKVESHAKNPQAHVFVAESLSFCGAVQQKWCCGVVWRMGCSECPISDLGLITVIVYEILKITIYLLNQTFAMILVINFIKYVFSERVHIIVINFEDYSFYYRYRLEFWKVVIGSWQFLWICRDSKMLFCLFFLLIQLFIRKNTTSSTVNLREIRDY